METVGNRDGDRRLKEEEQKKKGWGQQKRVIGQT